MRATVSRVESVRSDDEGTVEPKHSISREAAVRESICHADLRIGVSIFKTADPAAEPAFYVFPHPLDHSRVVVAVSEIMVQRGEAVLLAGLLHSVQLITVKCELVDIAPIEGGGIHGEAWCHSTVGANNYVVLAGAAIPFAKAEISVLSLHDPSSFR